MRGAAEQCFDVRQVWAAADGEGRQGWPPTVQVWARQAPWWVARPARRRPGTSPGERGPARRNQDHFADSLQLDMELSLSPSEKALPNDSIAVVVEHGHVREFGRRLLERRWGGLQRMARTASESKGLANR